MITFNNIVERFKVFAENHFFIETFSFGSPDDVDLTKFTSFPLMHLVYTGATYDPGTKTYNLEVYILDVPADKTKKVDRQKEVVSDAEQCAEDIIADIKNGGNIFLFAQDYEVLNATTTPLEEETKNVLSGVLLDLSVSIPYEWDACNAPIDGVSPEGGDEIAYARRGILRMLTVDSATDVLSVRTIKVTNGTLTDDGDGVVTLDTGGSGAESLNDLSDVNIVAPISTGQTLVYDRDASPRGFYNLLNSLANLSDTNITSTPSANAFLRYVSGAWEAVPVSIPSPPPSTTDGLAEGSTNLYFTEQRVSDNSDVSTNTAKVGITTQQASDITANNAKTGITPTQAGEITANTAKTSFPGFGTSGGTALEGDTALLQLGTSSTTALAGDTTTITTDQANAITANTAKNTYPSADATKLAGIETGADVTDSTNVAAAGALMASSAQLDGNLDVNGNEIVSTSNAHIILDPNGTGEVRLDKTTDDAILQLNHKTNGNNSRLELTEGNGLFGGFFTYDSINSYIGSINSSSDVYSIKINRAGDLEFLKAVKFISPATFEMTVDNDATNFPIELKDENSQNQVFYLKNSGVSDTVDLYLKGDSQITGNLEVQGNIISTSDANVKINPNGTGCVEIMGDGTSNGTTGAIQLNCSVNSHGVKIQSPAHSAGATYTLTLPDSTGSANQVLKTDGSGALDWVDNDAGVTSVTAGVGLDGGTITATGTIELANTAVTAGSYTSADITVDAQGRITAASNGTGGGGGGGGISHVVEDTTPQLGGDLDSNTKNIVFAKTSATNHSSNGDIVKLGTGSTTQGALHYLNSSGGWTLADADATGTAGGVMLAIALGTDPDVDGMLLRGMFTLDHDPGTIGDELYVSTTAGDITSTAPSATGDIVRVVGYCLDSTNGQIWFNPSNDFIELV